MTSAPPVLDRVAMNTLMAANKRQAVVTQELRRREEALVVLVNDMAGQLDAAGRPELATKLRAIGRLTKKPTALIQKAAEKVAKGTP